MYRTSKAKRAAQHLDEALLELIPLEESKEMFLMLIREIKASIPTLESIHTFDIKNTEGVVESRYEEH